MAKKLTPFHYWTSKVLPEVYDDSLSYYELLNKVVGYLNQAMKNVDTLSDNVISIYNTVVELQQYVSEHLDESVEAAIEQYFKTHKFVTNVEVNAIIESGVKLGTIVVDGVETELYTENISAIAEYTEGTKIGSITIGNDTVNFFSPSGSGSDVRFTPVLTTGVEIGSITINGETTKLFAPSGGGGSGGAVDSVNGRIGDVVLTAQDVGARPNTWTPTASEVGARPNTWTPTANEVGARPNTWFPTATQVGALPNTVTTLPNPNKIVFSGAVSAEYDGRERVEVEIPEGGVQIAQGVEKAGQFLVVGEDGNVTTQSFETWAGGSY